jgi:hypothetical protein
MTYTSETFQQVLALWQGTWLVLRGRVKDGFLSVFDEFIQNNSD